MQNDDQPAKQSYALFPMDNDRRKDDEAGFLPIGGSIDWSECLINIRQLCGLKLSENIHDKRYDLARSKLTQAMVEASVALWHISILERKAREESRRISQIVKGHDGGTDAVRYDPGVRGNEDGQE